MRMLRWIAAFCLIACTFYCTAQESTPQEPKLRLRSYPELADVPLQPRCADIADRGPDFKLLADACQYALSPQSLPNLICQETTQRSVNNSRLDVVTDRVTFYQGHDSYSDFTVNGKPRRNFDWSGGWGSNALFGSLLHTVFLPINETTFKLGANTTNDGVQFKSFVYHMPKNNGRGFNVAGVNPEMAGSIWINTKTQHLARIAMCATRIEGSTALTSYQSAIDYGDVSIADVGTVLLPVKAAVQVCFAGGCDRNIVTFHDCQKFASTSKIIPNPGP